MSKIKAKIESHAKFGIKLGLDNITAVLEHLGKPQDELKIIHIAGTNGKGSVSSIIASCLQAEGYTVAKYCSPYLLEFNEMFIVNQQAISDQQLEQYYEQLMSSCQNLGIELTLYEVTTAIMFLYANQQQVDYLVLEVGLGGRLDATNVVTPVVSAITNISLDHTNILGDTIRQIAVEKAGIIKPHVPLFTTETNSEAISVFKFKADNLQIVNSGLDYRLNYQTFQTEISYQQDCYHLNLFGAHQVQNFALAVAILEYLGVSDSAVKQGVETVVHPARLERLDSNLIFDGAHNPASAQALVESLHAYPQDINIIFSVLADKDVREVVRILATLSPNLTFVPLDEIERGMSSFQFKQLGLSEVSISDSIEHALKPEMLNLICGTFSLYPQIIEYINRKNSN